MSGEKPDEQALDRASSLAEFLFAYDPPEGLSRKERRAARERAIVERFPDLTDDELIRGYQIATELMRADTVELDARTAKVTAELRRRKKVETFRTRFTEPRQTTGTPRK